MTTLDDLRRNAAVGEILPDAPVSVGSAQWFGSEALELADKTPAGKVANRPLYQHDEPRIVIVEQDRSRGSVGNGALFLLVSEAQPIRLACLFDPVLPTSTVGHELPGHRLGGLDVKFRGCGTKGPTLRGGQTGTLRGAILQSTAAGIRPEWL